MLWSHFLEFHAWLTNITLFVVISACMYFICDIPMKHIGLPRFCIGLRRIEDIHICSIEDTMAIRTSIFPTQPWKHARLVI
jgi:hypothetical protein